MRNKEGRGRKRRRKKREMRHKEERERKARRKVEGDEKLRKGREEMGERRGRCET